MPNRPDPDPHHWFTAWLIIIFWECLLLSRGIIFGRNCFNYLFWPVTVLTLHRLTKSGPGRPIFSTNQKFQRNKNHINLSFWISNGEQSHSEAYSISVWPSTPTSHDLIYVRDAELKLYMAKRQSTETSNMYLNKNVMSICSKIYKLNFKVLSAKFNIDFWRHWTGKPLSKNLKGSSSNRLRI